MNSYKIKSNGLGVSSVFIFSLIFSLFACNSNNNQGWPTYRHDGFRSGMTDNLLPEKLGINWVLKSTHAPVPAWHNPGEELPRMHSDNAYHIVSSHGLTYFGSSVDNKLYALNTITGEIKWTFFAEGPIRFAPSIWKNRIYFGSDDGNVYCLSANNGKLLWTYRAGPSEAKLLGNGRMISLWPVRTSVLVENNIVYFAAGVFPYEGIYVCALDADNGDIIWKNDTIGDKAHELQFGGISPHGYLLASENNLYVPSGRAMPAVFNRNTGEFLYTLSPGSKVGGTWGLIADDVLLAGVDRSGTPAKVAYDVETGRRKGDAFVSLDGIDMVTTSNISFVVTEKGIHAIDRIKFPLIKDQIDSLQKEIGKMNGALRTIGQLNLESGNKYNKIFDDLVADINSVKMKIEKTKNSATKWQVSQNDLVTIILAKDKLVAGGKGQIFILDAETGDQLQEFKIDGTALGLAVSDGCLLATTENGTIYCFNENSLNTAKVIKQNSSGPTSENEKDTGLYKNAAAQILKESGIDRGFCLVLDAGEGELALELVKNSDLYVIGIESDKKKVNKARKKLDKSGLYGSRVVIENWDLENLPDYFANLVVADDFLLSGKIDANSKEINRILKPLGGTIYIGQTDNKDRSIQPLDKKAIADWMKSIEDQPPIISEKNGTWMTVKRGALAGAGSWTHQYSNAANTICSDDELVNYPFGVLWFGEPGPEKMVERHARAAAPLAKDGRLFIQGENVIMAYDSYNGVKLWEREISGANRVRVDVDGSNLALSENGLLVAIDDHCLRLDEISGETLNTYKLPPSLDGKPRRWGYIASDGSTLFGTTAKPFDNEYNHIWTELCENNNLPQSNPTGISVLFSQEESPDKTWNMLQQSGAKWHFITDFPAWDGGIITQEAATDNIMHSDALFAMDLNSGAVKWIHRGNSIAHISISIGDGHVHFADNVLSKAQKQQAVRERQIYRKNGTWKSYEEPLKENQIDARLVTVLDSESGNKIWQRAIDLSGCGGDAVASAYKDNILLFFGSFGLHDKWRFSKGELKWHRVTAVSSNNGNMLWSRPLNYMVRPVIVGDEIIVEPRACDLYTGEIKTRHHPITGKPVPWEYYRPGHTCAVTSASSTCLFYRSYNTAFYDLKNDQGITYYGAIRPGCWINMIPANGLLLFPEASAGCTCSFPLRTTMVLKPKAEKSNSDWSVFTSQGPITPVKRLAINLGAPGDKRDKDGQIWFGYPRPRTEYGVKFNLHEDVLENMGYYYYDVRDAVINGTDKPWLYTSGCAGLAKCDIPLIDERWSVESGIYTVRLGFFAPSGNHAFDIKLQGKTVLRDFNASKETGKEKNVIVKEFQNIKVENNLLLELISNKSNSNMDQASILNSIEIIRQDSRLLDENKIARIDLNEHQANQYIKRAKEAFAKKQRKNALNYYHTVLEFAPSIVLKEKALIGMEQIGSEESLSFIEKYLRQTTEIYWDYKKPSADFIDKVDAVYVAIAKNQVQSNPKRATAMLEQAAAIATDGELSNNIAAELFKLVGESKSVNPEKVAPGITYTYYEGNFTAVASLDQAKSKTTGVIESFVLNPPEGVSEYGIKYDGFISVPKDGMYTFFIESNDGSKLYINGRELINNDGGHGAKEETGKVLLSAGLQPISVKYFQMGGGQALKVSWQSDSFQKTEISSEHLFHKASSQVL